MSSIPSLTSFSHHSKQTQSSNHVIAQITLSQLQVALHQLSADQPINLSELQIALTRSGIHPSLNLSQLQVALSLLGINQPLVSKQKPYVTFLFKDNQKILLNTSDITELKKNSIFFQTIEYHKESTTLNLDDKDQALVALEILKYAATFKLIDLQETCEHLLLQTASSRNEFKKKLDSILELPINALSFKECKFLTFEDLIILKERGILKELDSFTLNSCPQIINGSIDCDLITLFIEAYKKDPKELAKVENVEILLILLILAHVKEFSDFEKKLTTEICRRSLRITTVEDYNAVLRILKYAAHFQLSHLQEQCEESLFTILQSRDEFKETLDSIIELPVVALSLSNFLTVEDLEMLAEQQVLKRIKSLTLNDCPQIKKLTSEAEFKETSDQFKKVLKIVLQSPPKNLSFKDCMFITDETLKTLKEQGFLEKLESLTLSNCPQITNQGLAYLSDLALLKHLDLGRNDIAITDQGLAHLQKLPLTHLNLKNCSKITNEALITYLDKMPLEHLDLEECFSVGHTFLATLQTKPLKYLSLAGSSIENISYLRNLPLTHLYLSDCCSIKDFSILENIPTLQHLDLTGCNIEDKTLIHLAKLSLIHLNLSHCFNITDVSLFHLRKMPLEYLNLLQCSNITDEGLFHLSEKQLKYLNLSGCQKITDRGFISLNLSLLESLTLSHSPKITNESLFHLQNNISLKYLKLINCEKITDAGFSYLKDKSSLTSVSLINCQGITDQGITFLKNKNLKDFTLLNCKKITDQSLPFLKSLTFLKLKETSEKLTLTNHVISHNVIVSPSVSLFSFFSVTY